MKSIVNFINERYGEPFINLIEYADLVEIEQEFKKIANRILPNFYVDIQITKSPLKTDDTGDVSHNIDVRIGTNAKRLSPTIPNGIGLRLAQTDMKLDITHFVGDVNAGIIYIKPPAGSFKAMQSVKIPFKRPQPTVKANIKAFETHLLRYKQALKDNIDELIDGKDDQTSKVEFALSK